MDIGIIISVLGIIIAIIIYNKQKKQNIQKDIAKKTDEVFTFELLEKPIHIKRDDKGYFLVHIDRSGTKSVIYTNQDKRKKFKAEILKNRDELVKYERKINRFLSGRDNEKKLKIDLAKYGIKLRWASGGGVPLIRRVDSQGNVVKNKDGKEKKYVAVFFRDKKPDGWNIALGSSQRHFDGRNVIIQEAAAELNHPLQICEREFFEEILVLAEGLDEEAQFEKCLKCTKKIKRDFLEFYNVKNTNHALFINEHKRLRKVYDGLEIREKNNENEKKIVNNAKTKMKLIVTDGDIKLSENDDVLILFNLLEYGIEVVQVFEFDLKENEYILDGEILDGEPPELVRMPVALIDVEYIKENFQSINNLEYVYDDKDKEEIYPSFRVKEGVRKISDNIIIYQWDLKRREYLAKNYRQCKGSEHERYTKWTDKYLEESQIKPEYLLRYTPATAKAFNLMIEQGII